MLVITDFVTHMQVSSLLYNFISIQFSNQSVITTLVSHQKFVTKKIFGGTKFPTLIGSTTPQLLTGDQAVQFPIRSPQSPTLPLALISPPSVPKLAPFVSHLPDQLWPQAPSHSKSTVSTCALLVDLTLVFVILSFSISTSSLCLHNLAAEEFKVCHISSLIMISIVCSYTIIFYNSISSILCLESCGRAIYP